MELIIQIYGQEGKCGVVRLEGSRFILGRVNSDLLLQDGDCSRQHAEITQDERGLIWIQDLASTNGTFLNGTRVQAVAHLGVGDVLHLGGFTLRVKSLRSGNTQEIKLQDTLTGWPEYMEKPY